MNFETNHIEFSGIDNNKLKKDCQEFMIMGSVTSKGWQAKNCQVNTYNELWVNSKQWSCNNDAILVVSLLFSYEEISAGELAF